MRHDYSILYNYCKPTPFGGQKGRFTKEVKDVIISMLPRAANIIKRESGNEKGIY